jgi:hypothetical protein
MVGRKIALSAHSIRSNHKRKQACPIKLRENIFLYVLELFEWKGARQRKNNQGICPSE